MEVFHGLPTLPLLSLVLYRVYAVQRQTPEKTGESENYS